MVEPNLRHSATGLAVAQHANALFWDVIRSYPGYPPSDRRLLDEHVLLLAIGAAVGHCWTIRRRWWIPRNLTPNQGENASGYRHLHSLIPTALLSDRCPRAGCDGLDATWLGRECIPSVAASVDDGVVAVEGAVG